MMTCLLGDLRHSPDSQSGVAWKKQNYTKPCMKGKPSPVAPASRLPVAAKDSWFLEGLPGFVWWADASGELRYANRTCLEFFGVDSTIDVRICLGEAVHHDDRLRVLGLVASAMRSPQPIEFETRFKGRAGIWRTFVVRATPRFDEAKLHVGWSGLCVQVEGRQPAEAEHLRPEDGAQVVLDSVPGLLFTTTPVGEVEYVNRTLLDYFGQTLEELQGWRMSTAVHPDDLPLTIEKVSAGIAGGRPYSFEQRLRRFDGVYRWFLFSACPDVGANNEVRRWYGILTDLDDLKVAARQLQRVQHQLARAMHLASMSELAASIAHEVNQPLAAIVAHAHACSRWLTASPANVQRAAISAEKIVRDGRSAALVVERIRSLFLKVPAVCMQFDVCEAVREVIDLHTDELMHANVLMNVDLEGAATLVAGDKVQIQQVISNLLRNAMEAVQASTKSERRLAVTVSRSAKQVKVSVADDGDGLADFEQVFEPFVSSKPQGLGMGLAICRTIVKAHNGSIAGQTNAPRGCVFSFDLPLANA